MRFYTENDTHLEHRPSRPIVPRTVAVSGTGSLRWWWSPGLVCKELNNINGNIKNKWNWKQNFFMEYKMFLTSSLKWYYKLNIGSGTSFFGMSRQKVQDKERSNQNYDVKMDLALENNLKPTQTLSEDQSLWLQQQGRLFQQLTP